MNYMNQETKHFQITSSSGDYLAPTVKAVKTDTRGALCVESNFNSSSEEFRDGGNIDILF